MHYHALVLLTSGANCEKKAKRFINSLKSLTIKTIKMKTIFTTQDLTETLKQAENKPADLNAKLVAQMHAGVAHFFFTKKDGSVREAYGTLKKEFLERLLGPQDEENQPSEHVPNSDVTTQKYWDVEAGGFKAFNVENLICLF